MQALAAVGIGILALLCLLVLLFIRRLVISRGGGTVDMSVRLTSSVAGRGWAVGTGRFVGRELRWYRMFSLAPGPGRVLFRPELTVLSKRSPDGPERLAMPADSVILRCSCGKDYVEIALAEAALAGFLSWLEASPPGTR
jgi:hypothetical protein